MSLKEVSDKIDWDTADQYLTHARFRPMFDRAFYRLIEDLSGKQDYSKDTNSLRIQFIDAMDVWLNSSHLNTISGLDQFPDRDALLGVTHALDDLHITHYNSLVILNKEYAYYSRMRPDIKVRTLETLQPGDVLVLAAPFAQYGDLHPQTHQILEQCEKLNIPVHIDAAWYGCMRNFEFNYSHPAIQSVSFSLSKGLGLGSHRVGVRYSRKRWPGPVSIVNDFNMSIASTLWYGLKFMEKFPIDYLQEKYGESYNLVCDKLKLKKTKAIHTAMKANENGEFHPVGVRAFLRTLADDLNELNV